MTEKDKAVTDLIANATEAVEPQQANLKITYQFDVQRDAGYAMEKRGILVPDDFEGPDFKDIIGYQVNQNWLAVSTKDGSTYVYPASSIARIKHYFTPVEQE